MINEVYRAVQVVLNKNDRGIITPDRFNDLANMVQLKIFSEIPNDIRLAVNRINVGRGGETLVYLKNTLDLLNISTEIIRSNSAPYYFTLPDDLENITSVYSSSRLVECVGVDKLMLYKGLSIVLPTKDFPVYAVRGIYLDVEPSDINVLTVNYRRKVKIPKWTYINVEGKAVFNPTDPGYQDFELGDYFFNRIVADMLTFSGLHLKEQEVIQVSQQIQNTDFQKENMS